LKSVSSDGDQCFNRKFNESPEHYFTEHFSHDHFGWNVDMRHTLANGKPGADWRHF